jgi:hypothetical protein
MTTTYEIYDSIRREYYIRDEENVLDDLFDMLDEVVDRRLGGWVYTNFGLKAYVGDHCTDDTHLGTATGVREVLAWVCSPQFQAEGDKGAYQDLLERIQQEEADGPAWRTTKHDYPSL